MSTKVLSQSFFYIVCSIALVWGVVYANTMLYPVILSYLPDMSTYLNDIVSDIALLLAALIPAIGAPKFFGYRFGSTAKHGKMLAGMAAFFVAAPLLYRLAFGATPFSANTWFFEGVVVPLAEESFFRGVLFSILLWGFGTLYPSNTANGLTLVFSTLIFAAAHLNNLGDYPTSFILFQVGFSTLLGWSFGYTRLKTGSIYPAILLHAFFNLAGTL